MTELLLQNFVLLLVAVNPVLVLPEFVVVTANFNAATKRKIAVEAVLIAGGVLLAFTLVGQFVLAALGIELHAFQIAAGLILLLMSLRLVFDETVPHEPGDSRRSAIYPLAIPYLAGPKSIMTVLLLTDSDTYSVPDEIRIGALLVLVLALTLMGLLGATWAHRVLRDTGVNVISRVMGLILAALATQYILNALEQAFHIAR